MIGASTGVRTMKIQGQVHHTAPTTLFSSSHGFGGQIYMYEPETELHWRLEHGAVRLFLIYCIPSIRMYSCTKI